MLARLISARQLVLMCTSSGVHPFYCGQVYSRPTGSDLEDLPRRKRIRYCPIWALIDVDYKNQGRPITAESNIWPIQASSLKTIRWKAWSKQNGATLLGLPLWDMGELIKGYAFNMFSPSDCVI